MVETDTTIERLEQGFRLGDFFVEPQLQRISGRGGHVRVEPRVMEVLVALALRHGRPVSKREFMDRVWDDTVVTEDALLRCISELRKIFDDDPRQPRYIETIRKRGYRLIAPVVAEDTGSRAASAPIDAAVALIPAIQLDSASQLNPATSFDSAAEVNSAIQFDSAAQLNSAIRLEPSSPRSDSTNVDASGATPVAGLLRGAGRKWVLAAAAVVMVAGIGFSARQAIRGAMLPLQAVPLTSFPGEELDPSVSPDGDHVAFVWNGGSGPFDIYVKRADSEAPVRLTSSLADESNPTWSPNGREIAFIRSTEEASSIHIVPLAGSGEREIARFDGMEVTGLIWSPDDRFLAFARKEEPHGAFALWVLSLKTLESHRLTDPPADILGDLSPAYSPRGNQIAFARTISEKVADLYVVPSGGGTVRRLTRDQADVSGLDWLADGRSLLYGSDREGSSMLWKISASGRGKPKWIGLTGAGPGIFSPSVSRAGRGTVFVQRSVETNIWQLSGNAPDSAPSRPIIASTRRDSHPSVSPDGSRIVFVSDRTGTRELWMAEKGAEPLQLTRLGQSFTSTPRWSPEGRSIAFAARGGDGSSDIFVLDPDDGAPRIVTRMTSNDRAPSWSADGKWLYFASNASGDWEIWKMPADGEGEALQVTQTGGYFAMESQDGRALYFVRRDAPGIWRLDLESGEEALVFAALHPYDWGNWSITERGLLVLERTGSDDILKFVDSTSGEITASYSASEIPKQPAVTASRSGDVVLYSRIDRRDSDLWFVTEVR